MGKLLIAKSLRRQSKNTKFIKKINKMIKDCVYCNAFDEKVYSVVFSLYRRRHHSNDANLYDILSNTLPFQMSNYCISQSLQIDNESECFSSDANSETLTNSSLLSSVSSFQSLKTLPFQTSIDKLWAMSYCHSPIEKLKMLVEFQQSIIENIDEHRRQHRKQSFVQESDNEQKEESEASILCLSEDDDENGRTHGFVIESDDDFEDMNALSLISYESTSENQNKREIETNKGTKRKRQCKQLLVSGDDMIPLFCFILVQSKMQSVLAEIAFIDDFMSEEEKQMKAGYYLTTLKAATTALRERKLPIP